MRFPLAGWAWPPGPRVSAAHNSGVDGRGDGREKGPMQAASGFQRDKTRPATRLGGPPGTKLSQHAPKRRFRPTFRMQGELYPACRAASGTKLSQQAALTGPPGTKLSQRAPKRQFRPTFRMQGELCTASATNNPSRENFIPHAEPLPVQNSPGHPARRPTRYKTLPASGLGRPTRYKTLPASGLDRPTRYKTLPASPKTPISALLSHAGRTLYRFRHQQPEQGELYPACGATSGTKLSLPPGSAAHPVQNSPCCPARRPTRYKTLPARPKTPISAHFSHAGRTLYRFRHQHDKQGEKSHAPTPHRTPTTYPSPNFACNSIE